MQKNLCAKSFNRIRPTQIILFNRIRPTQIIACPGAPVWACKCIMMVPIWGSLDLCNDSDIAALAVMTTWLMPSLASASGRPGSRVQSDLGPLRVCNETGQLFSRGLFLTGAAVRHHIAASTWNLKALLQVPCQTGLPGELPACDVMAGAGGPVVLQGQRRTSDTSQEVTHSARVTEKGLIPSRNMHRHEGVHARSVVVRYAAQYAQSLRFESDNYSHLVNSFCTPIYWRIPVCTKYVLVCT